MSKELILAIDQGTTSTTSLLVNQKLKVISKHTCELSQIFPKPGWVEQRSKDVWNSVKNSITACLEKTDKKATDIAT